MITNITFLIKKKTHSMLSITTIFSTLITTTTLTTTTPHINTNTIVILINLFIIWIIVEGVITILCLTWCLNLKVLAGYFLISFCQVIWPIIKIFLIFLIKRLLNLCNTPDKFLNINICNGYGNNNHNGFKLVN